MKVHVMQKLRSVLVMTIAASLVFAAPALAVPVLTIDAYSMASLQGASTVGWEFFTNEAITVSHLGFFDYGVAGLLEDHAVGIWDSEGNQLVSGLVSAGTGNPLVDGFRYTEIAPLVLEAGEAYVVAAYTSGLDLIVGREGTLTTDPAISFLGPRSAPGGFALPLTSPMAASSAMFGPNFQIGDPVPEPSTLILLGLGLSGAAALRRRSRNRKSR